MGELHRPPVLRKIPTVYSPMMFAASYFEAEARTNCRPYSPLECISASMIVKLVFHVGPTNSSHATTHYRIKYATYVQVPSLASIAICFAAKGSNVERYKDGP